MSIHTHINEGYRYLVAIEDFRFEDEGAAFLNSGAAITITNGQRTVERTMEATSITRATE